MKSNFITRFIWVQLKVFSRLVLCLLTLFNYGYVARLENYIIPTHIIWILVICVLIWIGEPILKWYKELKELEKK